MNEVAQHRSEKPPRRPWQAVIPLLLLAAVAFWWFRSRVDSRFVGTWVHPKDVDASTMQTFELRGDGTGDMIPTPGDLYPVRWWYDGKSVCLQPGKESAVGQLIESFQKAIGMRRDYTIRLHVVSIDETYFEYIFIGPGRTSPKPEDERRTVVRRAN